MSDVGYATLPIIPSMRGAQRSIERELNGVGGRAGTREGEEFGRRFGAAASRSTGRGLGFLKSIAKGAAYVAVGALAAGSAIAAVGVKGAANLETTTTSFTALLGSTKAATDQIATLQKYAAATPFKQADVLGFAQQYYTLAGSVGLSKDRVTDFLDSIGNLGAVTGASADNIKNAVRAIGQMGSSGKVTLDNLNQVSEAFPGFNGAAAIAAATGKSTAEVMKEISAGTLDAKTGVNALIEGMQKFPGAAGAMQKQSQTLNGLWSTFTDTIQISLTQAFQPLIPTLKNTLSSITPVISTTLQTLAPAISSFVGGFTKFLGPLISGLGTALTAIFQALGPVFAAIAPVIKPLASAFAKLVQALSPIITLIAKIVGQIGPPFLELFGELFDAAMPIIKALADALAPVLPVIADALRELMTALKPVIKTLAGAFVTVIQQMAPYLPQIAQAFGEMAIAVANLLVALLPIINPLVKLAGYLTAAFAHVIILVAEAVTGLAKALKYVVGWVGKVVDGIHSLANKTAEFLGLTETIKGHGSLAPELRAQADAYKHMGDRLGTVIGRMYQLSSIAPGNGIANYLASLTDGANRLGGALAIAIARIAQLGSVGSGIGKKFVAAPKIPHVDVPGTDGGGSSTPTAPPAFDKSTISAFLGTAVPRNGNPLADALDAIFASARAAHKSLTAGLIARLRTENSALSGLVKARAKIADQLTAAHQKLSDLKSARAAEVSTVASAVVGSFDITRQGSSIDGILARVKRSVARAGEFATGLKALAKEGLSKTLLQQLAEAGPSALPQVRALSAATPKQIAELNGQYRALAATGSDIGSVIGDSMFKSGIDAANGLIEGLKSRQSALTKAIAALADKMVAQIKKSLKIKSPSRVTRELGSFTGQGFALGLADEIPTVERHAKSIANASLPAKHIAAGLAARGGGNGDGRTSPLIGHLSVEQVDDTVGTANAVVRRLQHLGAV